MRTTYLLFLIFTLSFSTEKIYSFEKYNISLKVVVSNDTIIKKRLSFQTINSDCTENFTLFNEENNINYTYNAENVILTESNYKVSATNNEIRMKAGNTIVLKPNTFIKKGALYLARIEDCEKQLCENLLIPKGISPDNNNSNDYLDLSSHCSIKLLKIFNRYGVSVYQKENYKNEWSGVDNKGNELPNATYYYYIEYESGKQKTGWIYLNK